VYLFEILAYVTGGFSSVQPYDLAGIRMVYISVELCAVADV
jgi:hypothetical protein